jgi:uncharacterized membrane protein HdeD (DUF308 family)
LSRPEHPAPSAVVVQVGSRHGWRFVFGVGVAALIAGLITVVWPGVTVLALVIVLGIYLLIAGASEVAWALAERPIPGWGLLLTRGIVNLLAGVVVLAWPSATAWALALLLAAWLLVYAVVTLWYAYRYRGQRPHRGHFVAKGIAALVAAVVTIAWPGITVLVVALVIGLQLLFSGIVLIRLALELRRTPPAPVNPTR